MQQLIHNQASVPNVASQGGFAALQKGLSKVIESPLLILGLGMLSLFTALVSTLPVRAMLREVLALRPLAERIAKGEYDVGLIEIMNDNPAAMAAVTSAITVGVLCFFLLHALISGGILSRLSPSSSERYVPAGQFLVRCAESASPMLKLELLFGLAVRTPLLLLGGAAAGFAIGWSKAGELSWGSLMGRLAPVVMVFVLAWSLASIWLTLARMKRLDDNTRSAWQSLRAGLHVLGQRPVLIGALLLAVLGLIGHGGLLVLGRTLTIKLDAKMLVLWAFVIRQALSLLRTALSMLIIAATSELADDR